MYLPNPWKKIVKHFSFMLGAEVPLFDMLTDPYLDHYTHCLLPQKYFIIHEQ